MCFYWGELMGGEGDGDGGLGKREEGREKREGKGKGGRMKERGEGDVCEAVVNRRVLGGRASCFGFARYMIMLYVD